MQRNFSYIKKSKDTDPTTKLTMVNKHFSKYQINKHKWVELKKDLSKPIGGLLT